MRLVTECYSPPLGTVPNVWAVNHVSKTPRLKARPGFQTSARGALGLHNSLQRGAVLSAVGR